MLFNVSLIKSNWLLFLIILLSISITKLFILILISVTSDNIFLIKHYSTYIPELNLLILLFLILALLVFYFDFV